MKNYFLRVWNKLKEFSFTKSELTTSLVCLAIIVFYDIVTRTTDRLISVVVGVVLVLILIGHLFYTERKK